MDFLIHSLIPGAACLILIHLIRKYVQRNGK